MPLNSSSSPNITLVSPPLLSSSSSLFEGCLKYIASSVIFSTYTFINVLLLPLYILVLYMGFQRWRNQSSGPAGQSTSHSDIFTYHTVALEIFGVVGSFVYCLGIYTNSVVVLMFGVFISCVIFPGQTLFHLLTCVERYLAVVHPIAYMHLRETGGVRIRNISILCVWLVCFAWMGVTKLYLPSVAAIPLLCICGVSIIVIIFSCLSVLCVLTRSGPGEVGRNKERVDQSKQRAFHFICAILGALLLSFIGLLVSFGFAFLESIRQKDLCLWIDSAIFLMIPSSLVMPLLFLHKTGKLACCRPKARSG